MITLDWMLPGCDGLEIAKAVREAGLETTILMLSALAEGIQGFFPQHPVEQAALQWRPGNEGQNRALAWSAALRKPVTHDLFCSALRSPKP